MWPVYEAGSFPQRLLVRLGALSSKRPLGRLFKRARSDENFCSKNPSANVMPFPIAAHDLGGHLLDDEVICSSQDGAFFVAVMAHKA